MGRKYFILVMILAVSLFQGAREPVLRQRILF